MYAKNINLFSAVRMRTQKTVLPQCCHAEYCGTKLQLATQYCTNLVQFSLISAFFGAKMLYLL